MGERKVYVEFQDGLVVRLFKNMKEVALAGAEHYAYIPRKEAVSEIRRSVFRRSKGNCEYCGGYTTWHNGEMHEAVHKGKGGEVSLENCKWLCHGCHTGRQDSEHGERRWHKSPKTNEH